KGLTLRYPDVPGAQLFAGEAMLRAGALDRARAHFIAALGRHPSLREFLGGVLASRLDEQARSTNDAKIWFQLAFVQDVLGEGAHAREYFQRALDLGIPEPLRSYTEGAMTRLTASAG